MLYRITLAVDVEAGTITDAAAAAHKAVVSPKQIVGTQDAAHVTRCEVTEAVKL